MLIEHEFPLVEEILGASSPALGRDFDGYRNHVYRVINFCLALRECSEDECERVVIAGCFHDLGIWTGQSWDYLPPSVEAARAYLARAGRVQWSDEVAAMIESHHKLRRVNDEPFPLVDTFRRGDLVDFSLGVAKSGLPGSFVREVKAAFPNAGYHRRMVQLEAVWWPKHPLRPVPVLKW